MYLVWINPPINFTFSDDSVFLKQILAGDINSLNLLVILTVSHFGFEDRYLVLIATVHGHCLPFTLYIMDAPMLILNFLRHFNFGQIC